MNGRLRAALHTAPVVFVAAAAVLREVLGAAPVPMASAAVALVVAAALAPVLPVPRRHRRRKPGSRHWHRFRAAVPFVSPPLIGIVILAVFAGHHTLVLGLLLPAALRAGLAPRPGRVRRTLRECCATALLYLGLAGTTAALLSAVGAVFGTALLLPGLLGRRSSPPGRASFLPAAAVAAVALLIALLLPVGSPARSPQGGSGGNNPGTLGEGRTGGNGPGTTVGADRVLPGRNVTLGDIGRLQMDLRPVLEASVTDADGEQSMAGTGRMLRGGPLEAFDGLRWTMPSRPAALLEDGIDGRRDGWIPLPRRDTAPGIRMEFVSLRLRYLAGGVDTLFTPGVPLRVGGSAVATGVLVSPDGEIRAPGTLGENDRLTALCRVDPDPRPTLAVETLDPERRAVLLEIPPGHEGVIEGARAALPPSATGVDLLRAVEAFLAERCTYSLDIPDPGGKPSIVAFLEDGRRGHCELFASAAALLLRSRGVPARLVVGFRGGVPDPERGVTVFRGADAHAWVEAHFGDRGWVAFDPTVDATSPPGGGGGDEEAARRGSSATWLDGVLGIGQLREGAAKAARRTWETVRTWPAWWWGLPALLLGWLFLRRRRRAAGRSRDPLTESSIPPTPAPDYLRILEERLARDGLPPRPSETRAQWIHRALESGAAPREVAEEILAAWHEDRWGGRPPDEGTRRRLEARAATVVRTRHTVQSGHDPGTPSGGDGGGPPPP